MSKSLYFARQPILDIHGNTYAYELLYRSSFEQSFHPISDDREATAQVLVNTLNLTGINNILGGAFAFINIDRELLMDEMVFSIPTDKFVLEILETVTITEPLIERIKELKAKGYSFALDDVDCSKEYVLNFQPIFEYIDVLKLDITILDEEKLPQFLSLFKKFDLKILAEKVETQEEFEKYKAYGCDYFQGYYFARPDIIENKRLDPEHVLIIEMIRQIQIEYSVDEISHSFEQNAALTLQLLRFINSAAFSFRSSIKSIRQAIMLLGPNQLKSWLLLISYAKPTSGAKGLQNPLLKLAQTRSNMMQTLSKAIYKDKCDRTLLEKGAFIGLLSLVEALFQSPIQTILKELNVDGEIADVLILHKGDLGKVYQLVCAVELFDTESVDMVLDTLPIKRSEFSKAIQDAYEITEKFISDLSQTI
jgi:EAL and modified HD-GYP domain-containing signal transduction protein